MTHFVIDRAKEVASSSGSGSFTLTGAASGFQAFGTKLTTNGDTAFYTAVQGADWESGILTRTGSNTYSRAVYDNSAGTTSAISFASAPTVFSTVPGKALRGLAFKAYQSSGQAITAGAFTKVTFTTEVYDIGACFASSRFTPTLPGVYHFDAGASVPSAYTSNSVLSLYKNGASETDGIQVNSSTYRVTVSGDMYLDGNTDYVEVYAFINPGLTLTTGINQTYFCGHLVAAG